MSGWCSWARLSARLCARAAQAVRIGRCVAQGDTVAFEAEALLQPRAAAGADIAARAKPSRVAFGAFVVFEDGDAATTAMVRAVSVHGVRAAERAAL